MVNKPMLDQDQVMFLTTRVDLSRALGIFSLADLAIGWNISLATLHRYKSSAYRQTSRECAKRSYLSYQNTPRGLCHRCQQDLTNHHRCQDCTILMHDSAGLCQSCVDSRARHSLKEYDLLSELATYV